MLAILTSLLDELIILAIILWGLPRLGIEISKPWLVVIIVLVAVWAIVSFRVGTRALQRKPLAGLSSMVGMRGRVVRTLSPNGMVKIMGEIWGARAESGKIEVGADILVTAQEGLRLTVRPAGKNESCAGRRPLEKHHLSRGI